jgi:hypothetical protein
MLQYSTAKTSVGEIGDGCGHHFSAALLTPCQDSFRVVAEGFPTPRLCVQKSRGGALKGAHLLATCFQPGCTTHDLAGGQAKWGRKRQRFREKMGNIAPVPTVLSPPSAPTVPFVDGKIIVYVSMLRTAERKRYLTVFAQVRMQCHLLNDLMTRDSASPHRPEFVKK